MNLRLIVERVEITGGGFNSIDVELEGVSESDLINAVSIQEIISERTDKEILDEIGIERCMEYFDLIKNEE